MNPTATHSGRCAIAVMAKAPEPGRVKTRLIPALSPQSAMRLSCAFLRDITQNLAEAGQRAPIDPYIAYAPAGRMDAFTGLLAPGTKLLLADGTGDMPDGVRGFGRCLLHATQVLFNAGYSAVCVLNADSPTLPTQYLVDAACALLRPGSRAVLGPADDGGYYLLGLNQAHAPMFADIAWSTESVADQTIARARDIGLELVTLPVWYDVDDAAALGRLLQNLAGPPAAGTAFAAPATRACLQRLGLLPALVPP